MVFEKSSFSDCNSLSNFLINFIYVIDVGCWLWWKRYKALGIRIYWRGKIMYWLGKVKKVELGFWRGWC